MDDPSSGPIPPPVHLHKKETMANTAYSQMKISMKAAVWDREQTIVGRGIYTHEQMKEVLDTIEKMEEALLEAMPFVTDAIDCPEFKKGAVQPSANKIMAAINLIK